MFSLEKITWNSGVNESSDQPVHLHCLIRAYVKCSFIELLGIVQVIDKPRRV